MNRRNLIMAVTVLLTVSLLFTSCIGSFRLTNRLLEWNRSLDNKFVNELVFIAFCIVPVYGVTILADSLVLNSIEFWNGTNPISASTSTRTIETENGRYIVETTPDGYHISKEGEEKSVDLLFDADSRTWNMVTEGHSHKLLQFTDKKDEVVMFLSDGKEMKVELNEAGVLAFRQVAEKYTYLAVK